MVICIMQEGKIHIFEYNYTPPDVPFRPVYGRRNQITVCKNGFGRYHFFLRPYLIQVIKPSSSKSSGFMFKWFFYRIFREKLVANYMLLFLLIICCWESDISWPKYQSYGSHAGLRSKRRPADYCQHNSEL